MTRNFSFSLPKRCLAKGLTVLAVTTTVASTLAPPAQAVPSQTGTSACATYVAIMTPGTWETTATANSSAPVGMLETVGDALKAKYGNQIDVFYPAYSASAFDQGRTYADSKQTGIDAINSILTSACSTSKFLLAGYSQGADAAGDVTAAIGNGRGVIPAGRILGVGLVADPHQGTAGGTLVGPKVDGQGIGGVRPEGFGSLAPLVRQLCAPTDLYCSTNSGGDGLLAGLGKVLANPTDEAATTGTLTSLSSGANAQGGVTASTTGAVGNEAARDFGSSLVSDFSRVDLAGAGSTVDSLSERIGALQDTIGANRSQSQVAGVEASATSLTNTLGPVADIQSLISANPGIRSALDSAADGTPEKQTADVLTTLDRIDLPSTIRTAESIAESASSILGGNGTTSGLADSAANLGNQIAPLQTVAPDGLASATHVLSLLKPKTIVDQIVNVATGFSTLDYQGIVDNLVLLPQKVAALDVHGAHQIAGELNNQFAPIVKMAAGIDLHTLSALVAMIPDPSGSAQIASLVLGLLGNVDSIRLANDVGAIQEVGWKILETGDLSAATELLPIGLDLASVAVGVISGQGDKTSVDQLGAPSQATSQSAALGRQASSGDFAGLAGSLGSLAASQGASDLTQLVGAGIDAASFFASGAHQSYNDFQVDSTGRSALQWLIDFFTQKIEG